MDDVEVMEAVLRGEAEITKWDDGRCTGMCNWAVERNFT
jgi:hypothetical protein